MAKENYYNFINGNLDTEANLGKVVANIDTGQITNILSGDEKDTDYEYAQNTTKHILSAPKTRTISDTVDSKEQDLYYNKQAHGSVDKVNLTKEDYITDGVEIDREFNSYGLVNKEISPEKATTTIAYDSHNLYPATTTNDLNQATYTEYNLFNSQVATTTSPTGAKTVNRFDAFGRTKEVWISDADTPATLVKKQEISYQDSTLPRYVEVKDYFDASNFSTSREYYDGLDRVIQKKANTATTGQYTTVDTLYDSQGRVVHQSLPYITNSISYSSPNLTKPAKTYTYDALDRVLSESTPTGVTSYEYDGFKTTITDANGIQKDLTKDAYGNLVEVKEYNGVSTYTTGYDYTLTNKLEKITDSQGNIRNFHYDVLDNLDWQDMVHKSSVATPEKINYTHDKNGNVLTEASFKGDAISYVYDDLNRVLYEKLSGANQISYTYDQNDDVGQLSFADYGGGNSKAYDYDTLGRLRTATTTIENESFVMKYDYNLGGNLKEITYPNGWVVTYAFNGVGQVDEVLLDKGTGGAILSDSIEYNQNGQMTHYERANGVITDYTYDPLENFRLTDLVSVQSTTTLQDMHYDYDNIGNIMQIVDASDTDLAKTVDYQYDDLNRLGTSTVSYVTHPTDDYTRTYQYDAVGNMTYNSNLGVMDYDNDNPHQLSGYDTRTFMYDDAGNMTRNGGITKFAWDHRSRLKSTYDIATENSTYYKYDHNNQRMLKYTEDYVFIPPDPHEEPIMMRGMAAPMGGGGHWEWRRIKEDKYVDKYFQKDLGDNTKSHVYLGNIKLATLNNNDNPYYLLGDHLGSSSILTDDTGTVAEQIDYYPYGSKAYENIVTNMSNEYDFTGKEVDEETGIQYFVNRYYDNETGHFLSIDPLMVDILDSGEYNKDTGVLLANPQELNSYAYAVNNPVVYVDPTGNASLRAWLLNPLGTATIKSHFVGGVGYYQATGKRASADFLDHSLSLNPSDISVRSNNEHSYIIDEIKASGEYKDKLRNLVSEAESNNKDRIIQYSDKNVNKDERLEFNSGDLKTSIHGTYTNLIRGHKENGEWTFNTYITDKYDFSFDSGYDNLFSDSANNYTALGQNLGVVSNYNIDIQFEHKFNR